MASPLRNPSPAVRVASRRVWMVVVTLATWLVLGAFGGCSLPRGGLLAQQCTADRVCDDDNPCTDDLCGVDGQCVHEDRPDGPVAADPVVGDCQALECVAGVASSVDDDSDVPDDGNECTIDGCLAGNPRYEDVDDPSATCTAPEGTGTCAAGACVVNCAQGDSCDDDNPCTTDSCDLGTGICAHADLDGVPAPSADQAEGDCRLVLCEMGGVVDAIDNADLPDDANVCTDDTCASGFPVHTALAAGSACDGDGDGSDEGVCNGDMLAAACVGCNVNSDCGTDTDCTTYTCGAGNVCTVVHAPVDTPLPAGAQTTEDCQLLVCDGSGGTQINADAGDTEDDGNDCTQDVCQGTTPVHLDRPVNFGCGAGGALFCDGNGSCGECTENSQCGTDTFCRQHYCDADNVCQTFDTAAGAPLPAGQQTAGDCQEIRCNGNGGTVSVDDNGDLPPTDNNDCTDDLCTAGAVDYAPKALDTVCATGFCDGASNCVECNAASQCPAAPDCQFRTCVAKACGTGNFANDQIDPDVTQAGGDCRVVLCDGAGAVKAPSVDDGDLPIDGLECTQDLCNSGTPDNPPEAAGFACTENGGQVCNGSAMMPACVECVTDAQCPGFECDVAANTCCVPSSCGDLGKTCGTHASGCGNTVDCDGAKSGAETDVDCGGDTNACAARCPLADACLVDADCASGQCADGVCCDADCAGGCQSCNQTGSEGVCTLVAAGSSGDAACQATGYLCGGAANCPTSCGSDTDCESSHYCSGGFCNPKGGIGGVCTADEQCQMGNCVDGFCCDGACGGDCEACNLAGTEGTCTPKTAGTACGDGTDDACTNPDTCDGAGACLDNHEPTTTACGDQSDTECSNPNRCDGAGSCDPQDEMAGFNCGDTGTECIVQDTCDGSGTCTDNGFFDTSTACGDQSDTECSNPNRCDGAGACDPQDETAGFNCGDTGTECIAQDTCDGSGACTDNGFFDTSTACGDQSDTECSNPNRCDGAGSCDPQDEMAGFGCGDGSTTECTNPDSCDGAGTCLANHQMVGTACGDQGVECLEDDSCDGMGACVDAGPSTMGTACGDQGVECLEDDSCDGMGACVDAGASMAGTACGDPTDNVCNGADSCDGSGGCLDNFAAMTEPCGGALMEAICDPDHCDGAGACTDEPAAAMGTACGGALAEPVCDPDACDGAGACTDVAFAMDGTACADDGLFCTGAETCMTGACASAGDPCGALVCDDSGNVCADVWINELHYDDVGADADEGVEVGGTAGTDLSGWSIVLYDGGDGMTYATINLSGSLPDLANSLGVANFPQSGIVDGNGGLALVAPGGSVVQFLSYGGAFMAADGAAMGMTSTDIGVTESDATANGDSLQLQGMGSSYADFTWAADVGHTRGAVNTGQTFL